MRSHFGPTTKSACAPLAKAVRAISPIKRCRVMTGLALRAFAARPAPSLLRLGLLGLLCLPLDVSGGSYLVAKVESTRAADAEEDERAVGHLDHRSGLDRQYQIETGNDEGEDQELEAGEARFGHVLFACRELRLGDEIGEVELPVPYLPDDRQAEEQDDGGHHAGDDK